MHKSRARQIARVMWAVVYQFTLMALFIAPAPAQQVTAPLNPANSASVQSYLPTLPPGVIPPRLEAPHNCSYPHGVINDHPTGPAIVTFTVTAKGQVTNPSIARSSGGPHVDEGARECVTDWVYVPALRDGVPVEVSWGTSIGLTITTRSQMPSLPPDLPQGTKLEMMPVEKPNVGIPGVTGCEYWHSHSPHAVLVGFDVEPDGTVKNATVTESSGDPAIDKDAVKCVSRRTYKPATRGGTPVEIRLAAQLYANQ